MGKLFKCSAVLQGHVALLLMLSALSTHAVLRDDVFWLYIASRVTLMGIVTSGPHLCQDALRFCFGIVIRLVICCQWQVRYISCMGRVLLLGLGLTP